MELEQRVGRVHRFGSRETILVDTLVMRNSREGEAYAVADQKLRMITRALFRIDLMRCSPSDDVDSQRNFRRRYCDTRRWG